MYLCGGLNFDAPAEEDVPRVTRLIHNSEVAPEPSEGELHRRDEEMRLLRGGVLLKGFRSRVPVPRWLERLDRSDINRHELMIIPLAKNGTRQTNPIYGKPPHTKDTGHKLGYAETPFRVIDIGSANAWNCRFTWARIAFSVRHNEPNGPADVIYDGYINVHCVRMSDNKSTLYCGIGSDCESGLRFLQRCCLCGKCSQSWHDAGWTCEFIERIDA